MAEALKERGSFSERLRRTLLEGLKVAGIRAQVRIQKISGTRLYRVSVIAPQFEKLRPSERQELTWRIIGQRFKPEDQLRISMIYTWSDNEFAGRL